MSQLPWDLVEDKEERGFAIQNQIATLKKGTAGRRSRALANLELYERRKLAGFNAQSWENSGFIEARDDKDRLCLIQSAIETAKATLYAPQKPKPQFQTLGATWAARRTAYIADRACEGVINQPQEGFSNVWEQMWDLATDAMVTGTGLLKVTADRENKRIATQIVSMVNCFVDPIEGRNPVHFFEEQPIAREDVKRLYGNKVDLSTVASYEWGASYERSLHSEIIPIQHAWRLPYSKDEPGRWATTVGGKVLDEGEWSCPAFPFVVLRWIPSRLSFWGIGIPDQVRNLSDEVSDYDLRLWLRAIAASGKRIYYFDGVVNESDLTSNEAVQPVKVSQGTPGLPQESIVPPFTDAEFNYRERKIQNFWDAVGISQVSAAARREQGLSSGIALMTLNDTKAGRQLTKGQAFENSFVQLARQIVWRIQELLEKDPGYAVSWPGKRLLQKIDAKALADLEDDQYSVSVAPAYSLPHDPAGRQEMVQQLFRSGIIQAETAKQLIGWPDLDKEMDQSETEYIDELIHVFLQAEEDEWTADDYEAPEDTIVDVVGALDRFRKAWFRARIDRRGLTREERAKADFNIKLLENWMAAASKMLKNRMAAMAPPAPGGAAPGGQAPPPPAPPPALPSPVG